MTVRFCIILILPPHTPYPPGETCVLHQLESSHASLEPRASRPDEPIATDCPGTPAKPLTSLKRELLFIKME